MNSPFYAGFDEASDENPVSEKWVVAYAKSNNLKKVYYRQFFAEGFYEAYDRIMTFSEKTDYKIMWYKEKRKCGRFFDGKEISNLESICTYCNSIFNNIEPIKCNFDKHQDCKSEFCSFKCRKEHLLYLHINRKREI
jgi:hypothetical protein